MRLLRAPLGGGGRRLAAAGDGRRRAVPQPAGAGFNGPVYLVNPKASVVQSVAYKSVLEVLGPVDLAVLALPAPYVVEAVGSARPRGCGRSWSSRPASPRPGRRAPSAAGAAGRLPGRRDAPDRAQLPGHREHRPPGAPGRDLRPDRPAPGPGGVPLPERRPRPGHHRPRQRARAGAVVVRVGRQQGRLLQQRSAVVLGAGRPTGLVLLYLESFGNPRKFARIARHVARTKPVLAVKSGSAAGARATSSTPGPSWPPPMSPWTLCSTRRG